MNSRAAGIVSICLLLGVTIILSVPYLVWQPTVNAPNYWENHTDGLSDLIFLGMLGGAFVVVGFAIGFERSTIRYRVRTVRISAYSAVLGSLLAAISAYTQILEIFPVLFGRGEPGFFAVRTGAFILLLFGVTGIVSGLRVTGQRVWYGAGVIAGGFSLLAGAELLRWGLLAVEPGIGAFYFPPLGPTFAGTLAIAVGSVILGLAFRRKSEAPRWYGPLLIVAGLFSLPLGGLAIMGYYEGIGFYGLVWFLIGAHVLWTATDRISTEKEGLTEDS